MADDTNQPDDDNADLTQDLDEGEDQDLQGTLSAADSANGDEGDESEEEEDTTQQAA